MKYFVWIFTIGLLLIYVFAAMTNHTWNLLAFSSTTVGLMVGGTAAMVAISLILSCIFSEMED